MTVKGSNTVTFEDVLAGEVWVCSGQSNMQWAVSQANDPDLETATANYPHIRLITVPQVGTQEVQNDFEASGNSALRKLSLTFLRWDISLAVSCTKR